MCVGLPGRLAGSKQAQILCVGHSQYARAIIFVDFEFFYFMVDHVEKKVNSRTVNIFGLTLCRYP
jgi:hypothetical protein